jgi:hypothetical protein
MFRRSIEDNPANCTVILYLQRWLLVRIFECALHTFILAARYAQLTLLEGSVIAVIVALFRYLPLRACGADERTSVGVERWSNVQTESKPSCSAITPNCTRSTSAPSGSADRQMYVEAKNSLN